MGPVEEIKLLQFLITLTEPIFKTILNIVLGRGIDFAWILKQLGIDFI